MGILGIENRTENWKTVEHFYGLSDDAKVKLVKRLLKPLDTQPEVQAKDIKIELFWEGMRDYRHWLQKNDQPDIEAGELAKLYVCLFSTLREDVKQFIENQDEYKYRFQELKRHNYAVGDSIEVPKRQGKTIGAQEELMSNLSHTEIDIVVATPTHLFIGEAKHTSNLGAKSSYVLVHQLIRQYVMAGILVAQRQESHKIVPFVIGDKKKLSSLRNTAQVQFMIQQGRNKPGWLKEKNVLSWHTMKALAK